jgi:hypothetical protein
MHEPDYVFILLKFISRLVRLPTARKGFQTLMRGLTLWRHNANLNLG